MAKRGRKSRVPPGKGREWLERTESGESIKEIAEKENWDPRTIKDRIREAQQKREAHQARASVLRNALEKHYEDLCELACKIEEATLSGQPISLEFTDPYKWKALKQHIPRSPLWADVKTSNALISDIDKLGQDSYTAIKDHISKEAKTKRVLKQYEGALPGTIALLGHQFKHWSLGQAGLNIEESFGVERIDDRHSKINYGFSQMGEVFNKDIDEIKGVIRGYEDEIRSWDCLKEISDLRKKISDTGKKIQDQVALIKLRRVIAGHCDYCPA